MLIEAKCIVEINGKVQCISLYLVLKETMVTDKFETKHIVVINSMEGCLCSVSTADVGPERLS